MCPQTGVAGTTRTCEDHKDRVVYSHRQLPLCDHYIKLNSEHEHRRSTESNGLLPLLPWKRTVRSHTARKTGGPPAARTLTFALKGRIAATRIRSPKLCRGTLGFTHEPRLFEVRLASESEEHAHGLHTVKEQRFSQVQVRLGAIRCSAKRSRIATCGFPLL